MIGRLAPSPTGVLHVGNARSFLLAWLQVRAAGGSVVLRIDDLDTVRAVPGADDQIVEDLSWLGIDWDNDLTPNSYQSNRYDHYREGLERLNRLGTTYPCFCSRKELRRALSAPHGRTPRYPELCRELTEEERREKAQDKDPAIRLRVEPGTVVEFNDLIHGTIDSDLYRETGDFIIARSDGIPAYQLAVVIDDVLDGVTHVLRADDLLDSTPRQVHLYHLFEEVPPTYAHVPLILDSSGKRLAKRHGSASIEELRKAGASPNWVVGWMAWSAGLIDDILPVRSIDLVDRFSVDRINRDPVRYDETRIMQHVQH